jgi:hypothetical protein
MSRSCTLHSRTYAAVGLFCICASTRPTSPTRAVRPRASSAARRHTSSTRRASPESDATFIAASLIPSGASTAGAPASAGRLARALASRACTIASSCGVVYGWKLMRIMPAGAPSATAGHG